MFVSITNTPRPYAWGSTTAIPEFLGTPITGEPEAELWLGAHPGSPSVIVDPESVGGARDLAEWIAAEPASTLGRFASDGRLPFLLKVLAAGSPLSLQAHPTTGQAIEGFALENERGVPLDAPHRNYKDAFAKPELIYAVSPTFDALCGFRTLTQFGEIVDELLVIEASPELDDLRQRVGAPDALAGLVEWLSTGGDDVARLVSTVSALARRAAPDSPHAAELATVVTLADQYPGDPGIVISLMLNHVRLTRGEVLYLPAGNIHAYLFGLGIELMASSDNVLRGGLTPKHVDVPELLSVLDFSELPVPYLVAEELPGGVQVFRPDVADFLLVHLHATDAAAQVPLDGPAIALAASGAITLAGATGSITLARGESAYVTPDEGAITVTGSGELFVATTGA